jgi:hypothetical protein
MIKLLLLSCTAIALLGGCAGTYTLKEGQPKAFVRFTTNADPTSFWHVPQPLCTESPGNLLASFHTLSGKQLSEIRMLGSTGVAEEKIYERAVAAGEPTYILAKSEIYSTAYNPGHRCSLGVRVLFQPDHHYEVAFDLTQSQCRVRISELVKASEGVVRTPERSARSFPARYTKDFCGRE